MSSDDIKSQPDDGGIFFMFRSLFMICNVDNLINRNIPTLMTFSVESLFFHNFSPLLRHENVNVWGMDDRGIFGVENPFFLQVFRVNFKSSPLAMENSKTSSALWLWNMECEGAEDNVKRQQLNV